MMDRSEKDSHTIEVLMLRCHETYLPRAQRLLAKVNHGDKLRDSDIQFLESVPEEIKKVQSLIKRDHDYERVVAGFIDLVTEIISKGLENEKPQ